CSAPPGSSTRWRRWRKASARSRDSHYSTRRTPAGDFFASAVGALGGAVERQELLALLGGPLPTNWEISLVPVLTLLAASSPLHSLSPIAPKGADDGFPVSM